MARALDRANQFIIQKLEQKGVIGIVPSLGGILVSLLRITSVPCRNWH